MAKAASSIAIKRAYDPPADADGRRVLVDRLWARGVARNEARLTAWLKDVAPSDALRRWFGHDPARWAEFVRRYRSELDRNADSVERLLALAAEGKLTLIFGVSAASAASGGATPFAAPFLMLCAFSLAAIALAPFAAAAALRHARE